MKGFQQLLLTACERPIVLAAIRVALVVGTILNLMGEPQNSEKIVR